MPASPQHAEVFPASPILASSTRAIVPVLSIASVVVLLQGHNLPGGGFIGGLMLTAVVALRALTFGVASARRLLRL
ncbi:MAG: MnhB domain-containing protein, partial [Planctomycetota bacterium]|nr:MnhB domain-containing protein [Planctomycetota bacterium]